MIVLTNDELAGHAIGRSVCTIGNFDGVHLGHQAILRLVRDHALAYAGVGTAQPTRVVVTFEPHPRTILGQSRGDSSPALLTTFERKEELLAAHGIDVLVRVHFTKALSQMSPEEFIDAVLLPLHPMAVIVGHDFSFGRGGRGTAALLRARGADLGFDVTQAPAVLHDDTPISSSRIRALLAAGEIVRANTLLGRPHMLTGPVVHGARRGMNLGFPTANIAWGEHMLPGDGVYAGRAQCDGREYGAIINIGVKPTFHEQSLSLEAHLFDFTGDLYGRTVTVSFLKRLRDEIPFASVDDLITQLKQDERAARMFLESALTS